MGRNHSKMAYTSIKISFNEKKNSWKVEYTSKEVCNNSTWSGWGIYGYLYPVDGFLVLMTASFVPQKVFKNIPEFKGWIQERYNIDVKQSEPAKSKLSPS